MEEKATRFRGLSVVFAVIVGGGDVIALVIGGLAMYSGLLYLMGETCSMGALGVYIYGLTALVGFGVPLLVATVLLVVLARKRLPRWVRVALVVGVAAAIVVPLGALGSVWYADYHRKAEYERTMLLYTSGLHQAVVSGDVAKAEAILKDDKRALIERDYEGAPVLVLAVKQGNLAMVETLIRSGADVNFGGGGMTALLWAARNGREDIVRLLLDKGAKINQGAFAFKTPLAYAKEAGHAAVADLLSARGATMQDYESKAFFAVFGGDRAQMEAMRAEGVNVSALAPHGYPLICIAAQGGHVDMAEFLIAQGADVNASHPQLGYTPLHQAAQEGKAGMARFLLSKGAKINATDKADATPLHTAAWWGRADVAEVLIAGGANASAVDRKGQTPLAVALERKNNEVVELLRKAGAKE
ncbi:MAG: ankyrin repeat domain-containing protein [Planctomycetota bacterium]|nr:ankyrin repeat domain-containing protein [Planctomycetota bacterium]